MIYHKEVSYTKMEEIQKKIVEFLEKQEWPVTTEEVAKELKISWNTAQVHLLKLINQGKIKYKKVGRQNQFWLVKKYEKEF
ncbi:winged helix-turn-helix transcriptional regulator [Candidatus Woesearchaeota archaeon]|nr:winged helix-turn-helix transcriptional regulator [Candidatus Woesearchaeota archaeon]